MIVFVYEINFTDGSKYIGQTKNLNQRIANHKSKLSRAIDNILIVKTCTSRQEALAFETATINHYGLANLINTTISSHKNRLEVLSPNEEPKAPLDIEEQLKEIVDTKECYELKLQEQEEKHEEKISDLEEEHEQELFEYDERLDEVKLEVIALIEKL